MMNTITSIAITRESHKDIKILAAENELKLFEMIEVLVEFYKKNNKDKKK
jgi:hypothetical protein